MLYIKEWIAHFNGILSENLSIFLPDSGLLGIIAKNPLYVVLGGILIVCGVALFFDFIKDAWKVPFGILGDLLDLLSMQYPGLFDIISAVYSLFIFYLLASDPPVFQKTAMAIASLEGLIGINFPIKAISEYGSITNFLPTNTILMLIATVID